MNSESFRFSKSIKNLNSLLIILPMMLLLLAFMGG